MLRIFTGSQKSKNMIQHGVRELSLLVSLSVPYSFAVSPSHVRKKVEEYPGKYSPLGVITMVRRSG